MTTADDALTSVTSSSVDEAGTRGEVWMMGSGLLTTGVAGGPVNISAIGDDETTRRTWGKGGTGSASSLWLKLELENDANTGVVGNPDRSRHNFISVCDLSDFSRLCGVRRTDLSLTDGLTQERA